MGRSKIHGPDAERLNVVVSHQEMRTLQAAAKTMGTTVSQIVRVWIRSLQIKPKPKKSNGGGR